MGICVWTFKHDYIFPGYVLIAQLCLTLWTPWTVAHQAPLSVGFSRQEYWSGLPFPSPGIFPTQELNPSLLHWLVNSLHLSHLRMEFLNKFIFNFLKTFKLFFKRMHFFTFLLTINEVFIFFLSLTEFQHRWSCRLWIRLILLFLLQSYNSLHFYFLIIALARVFSTVRNKVARTNPCLIPDLEAKTSSIMLAVRFS